MVKFSIIVPVYNVEKYLRECIDSLINQTYENFEVILVDDGSPDNSPQICDEYAEKDNRIKVIHKEHGGVTSARKVGVSNATGEYIACVDADDLVENTYLEEFASAIRIYNPEVICCEFYTYFGTDKIHKAMPCKEGLYKKEDIVEKIFPILIERADGRYFPNTVWGKAMLKELFIKGQFAVDDRIIVGEDKLVTKFSIYSAESVYIINKPLYNYRYNFSSATKSFKAYDWSIPRLQGEYFEKNIDFNISDLKEQVDRMVVHSLFNIVESQFNRKEKYSVLAREIKSNLKEPYYQKAINNCIYTSRKGKVAVFALKNNMISMIKFFNFLKIIKNILKNDSR